MQTEISTLYRVLAYIGDYLSTVLFFEVNAVASIDPNNCKRIVLSSYENIPTARNETYRFIFVMGDISKEMPLHVGDFEGMEEERFKNAMQCHMDFVVKQFGESFSHKS